MITIGVVGAGYWGANIIRTFANLNSCRLKTVADPKSGRRDFVQNTFPSVEAVEDFRQILRDPAIDAVSIATPVNTHFEVAKEALLADKHVYVEKPFTHSGESARKLVELAEERGKKILVGHLFLYHPVIKTLKELIDAGRIGDLYCIEARRMNLRPPVSSVNVVWDLAPHDFSIINYLFGEKPKRLRAHGRAFKNPELADNVVVTLEYSKNRCAEVYVNWLNSDKTRRMTIFGAAGSIAYDDIQPVDKIRVYGEGIDSRIGAKDDEAVQLAYKPGDIVVPSIPGGQPLDLECRHFIECIENDLPILSDGENGYDVVRTLECVDASLAKDGAWVEL